MKAQKNTFKKFETLAAFSAYLATMPETSTWTKKSSQEQGNEGFRGTASYEEADNLLKYGDNKSYCEMTAAGLKIDAGTATKSTLKYENAVCGGIPNVPAYIAGRPACMINARRVQVATKVATLVYCIDFSGFVSKDKIIACGVAVVDAVRAIEAAGRRVNLYILTASKLDKNNNAGFILKVKDAGQKFDLKKLAYILVNPSMLRRHSFRFFEVTPGIAYNASYGYVINRAGIEDILKNVYRMDAKLIHGQTIVESGRDYQSEVGRQIGL